LAQPRAPDHSHRDPHSYEWAPAPPRPGRCRRAPSRTSRGPRGPGLRRSGSPRDLDHRHGSALRARRDRPRPRRAFALRISRARSAQLRRSRRVL
jgi:hypothetical protein